MRYRNLRMGEGIRLRVWVAPGIPIINRPGELGRGRSVRNPIGPVGGINVNARDIR